MNHRYGVMIVKYTLIRCANKTKKKKLRLRISLLKELIKVFTWSITLCPIL